MNKDKEKNEMREEYDFSTGVRGKHYKVLQKGYKTTIHKSDGSTVVRETRPIFLEPDLQAKFPTSEAVNRVLRELITIKG